MTRKARQDTRKPWLLEIEIGLQRLAQCIGLNTRVQVSTGLWLIMGLMESLRANRFLIVLL